jgi:hypothetical protein
VRKGILAVPDLKIKLIDKKSAKYLDSYLERGVCCFGIVIDCLIPELPLNIVN